jgi:hypothetical protein
MLNELRWWWREHTPRALWYKVKWFIQRGRRGWSASDNWSMFSYVGPMMADMLKDLRENGCGYKCVHDADQIAEHMLDNTGLCGPEDWWAMLHRIEFGLRYYDYVFDGSADVDHGFDEWRNMMNVAEAIKNQAFADLGEYWGSMWD